MARRAHQSQGRTAASLGANDPRARRSAQALQTHEITVGNSLEYRNDGRLHVKGAGSVPPIADTADTTPESNALKINQILEALKAAGIMKE